MPNQIPDDLSHALAQLAMPGADPFRPTVPLPSVTASPDALLQTNSPGAGGSTLTPSNAGASNSGQGANAQDFSNAAVPTGSQDQSNASSSADALISNLQQLLLTLEKSNATVLNLIEKMMVMMGEQQKLLEGLSRRADQLGKQIDSLKNP
jgi:hypothetical protein